LMMTVEASDDGSYISGVEEGKLYKRPSKSLINDYECCLRKRGFYV